jgi:hypothetical protein
MIGAGTVNLGKQRAGFAFDARESARFGDRGSLVLKLRNTKSHHDRWGVASVFDVRFSTADRSVRFTAKGTWNGKRGHRFDVTASDGGKGGRHDRFAVVVTAPNGKVVESLSGMLSEGDIRLR